MRAGPVTTRRSRRVHGCAKHEVAKREHTKREGNSGAGERDVSVRQSAVDAMCLSHVRARNGGRIGRNSAGRYLSAAAESGDPGAEHARAYSDGLPLGRRYGTPLGDARRVATASRSRGRRAATAAKHHPPLSPVEDPARAFATTAEARVAIEDAVSVRPEEQTGSA